MSDIYRAQLRRMLHELLDHMQRCKPCAERFLALVSYMDTPHDFDFEHPKLLHSMYTSTESPDRKLPG